MINQVINQRFEVLEKTSESTLFAVYRARDKGNNRTVALKSVQKAWQDDAPFVAGLKTGAHQASALKHPHIGQQLEWMDTQWGPTLVMEFVRGIDLKERIRRIAPFTLAAAVDVAVALVEALQFAHGLKMVHGDVRPQNVIVSPEGAVKLLDFGISSGICASPAAQHAVLLRSAPYHAPELSTTVPGTVAGDIYAMGAVLYEMLTGAVVYSGETPAAIADLHAFAPIPSPRALNPGVPLSLEGIVVKCLQKRPDQRYLNAGELLTDLRSVRDALRFGKPLSWSPIDLEKLPPESVTRPAATVNSGSYDRPPEQVPKSGERTYMSPNNRLRAREERVSNLIKGAIGFMSAALFVVLVGYYVVYSRYFVPPQTESVPSFVGMQITHAQEISLAKKIRLLAHGSYTDQARGVIFKSDQDMGAAVHPGQYINVWYSKGPMYVNVPNVKGMDRDTARKTLEDAGLTVGKLQAQYSSTVPIDNIISQDVSSKKRVLHDTTVDLTYSDGPTPGFEATPGTSSNGSPATSPNSGSSTGGNSSTTGPSTGGSGTGSSQQSADNPAAAVGAASGAGSSSNSTPLPATHTFNFPITLHKTPESGAGPWDVRITYTDSTGEHEVMDSQQNDGDKVPVSFEYTGSNITLKIYYNGVKVYDKKLNPQTLKKGAGSGQ